MKSWKKPVLAAILALEMVFPAAYAALAEEETVVDKPVAVLWGHVYYLEEGKTKTELGPDFDPDSPVHMADDGVTYEVEGSIDPDVFWEPSDSGDGNASLTVETGREDLSVHVTGDVTADPEGGMPHSVGVLVDADVVSATVDVDGSVTAVATETNRAADASYIEALGVTATAVYVYEASDGSSVTVDVTGKVSASVDTGESTDVTGKANAVDAFAQHTGTSVTVTIGEGAEGSILSGSVDNASMEITVKDGGVTATSGRLIGSASFGGTTTIHITGESSLTAERILDPGEELELPEGAVCIISEDDMENGEAGTAEGTFSLVMDDPLTVQVEESESLYGVHLNAVLGGEITAELNGISLETASKEGSATALGVYSEEGSSVTVTETGDVEATGSGNAVGVALYAGNGSTIDFAMEGDVIAETGLVLGIADAFATDEGTEGDETAPSISVLIDGTIDGGSHGILVSEDQLQIGDGVTVTVWQIVPNDDGAVVESADWDTEDGPPACTENKEAEKNLQYIIRIEEASEKYIHGTSGTKDYKGSNGTTYQVAHEGDEITLKLDIPESKEIIAAYWDENQTESGKLLKKDGNYYLVVPKGGGVVLSVVLADIPQQKQEGTEGKTDTPAEKPTSEGGLVAPGTEVRKILTIKHEFITEMEIRFYDNHTFKVYLGGKVIDEGKFFRRDENIVLVCDNDPEKNEMPFTLDEGGGHYELIFIPSAERNKENPETYNFIITNEDWHLLYGYAPQAKYKRGKN